MKENESHFLISKIYNQHKLNTTRIYLL